MYKKIPRFKILYAILQGYLDNQEFELEEQNMINDLEGHIQSSFDPHRDFEERKKNERTRKYFILNYKTPSNLQPIFKKIFDYLGCLFLLRKLSDFYKAPNYVIKNKLPKFLFRRKNYHTQ